MTNKKDDDNKSKLWSKRKYIEEYCSFITMEKKYYESQRNRDYIKNIINSFLESLRDDYREIFRKNFIEYDFDREWYLEFWSKGTYYKKLNLVTNLFLRFINDK